MDTHSPYTGDHSPLVKLDLKDPHGLSQSGISVRKRKSYTGRIVLAGDPATVVKVTLPKPNSWELVQKPVLCPHRTMRLYTQAAASYSKLEV